MSMSGYSHAKAAHGRYRHFYLTILWTLIACSISGFAWGQNTADIAEAPAPPPANTETVHISASTQAVREWVIASKVFTESVVLGELLAQTAAAAINSPQQSVRHQAQLGGTRLVWNALLAGEVHAYVDYSGTLAQEILQSKQHLTIAQLRQALMDMGLGLSEPLGFNNTYAVGLPEAQAEALQLERISQLADYPQLKLGFSHEFLDRPDGWPGLRQAYRLPQQQVSGLDHDLAYRALESGAIDLTDLYSTDAEVSYYQLRLLQDDAEFFPDYQALIVYRPEWALQAPAVLDAWNRLAGQISAQEMSAMNSAVKLNGQRESAVASDFLNRHQMAHFNRQAQNQSRLPAWLVTTAQRTQEHMSLVLASLLLAICVALPLGVMAAKWTSAGRWILATCGLLQTIPSLALFVFLIPLLGIGAAPAIAALFLYSLLPIVRNTYTGLSQIPSSLIDSARSLGLTPGFRLWRIELPLASPTILAGIQTAAVINVGTATLAALIGAGGFGQPILTGIRLDDTQLIMHGAVPAAALALLTQAIFTLLGRFIIPRGLQ